MNRMDQTFEALHKQGKKALIAFITAGDAGLETTERLVLQMEQSGADIIELGIPFSDPIAEGPVIQKASVRALQNGVKLTDIFAMVKRLRQKTQVPLVMMMYLNSIFGFGTEKFFTLCADTGIDGVIVPDMPYEERDEIQEAADRYGVYSISLVAPTSRERVAMIAKESKGFLYCVSSTGETGMTKEDTANFDGFFGMIKQYANIPCVVGVGISEPEQVSMMKEYCDGVIADSAIVELVEQYGKDSSRAVGSFVASLRQALDE